MTRAKGGPDERETRSGHQEANSNSGASAAAHNGPELFAYDDGEEEFIFDPASDHDALRARPNDATQAGTRGDFFAIDRTIWRKVCALRLNAAVAYLVLARFTGRTNKVSRASVNAIEEYTGIARRRARDAIDELLRVNIITQIGSGSRPRYDLLPGQEGVQPGKRGKRDSADHDRWIWLPNALVTGAAEEVPPVERVRQTQDVMTLRLLVELYQVQNLREDGGISRMVLRQEFTRRRVGESGPYVVWGFENEGRAWVHWSTEVTASHRRENLTEQERADGKNNGVDFWPRLNRLVALGLVEWVPCVFESDSAEAERLFPYGTGGADGIEDRIGAAAQEAGIALLTEGQAAGAEREDLLLVPLPTHLDRVTMSGVARMRYRPHTALTAAWRADLQRRGQGWLDLFKKIARAESPGTVSPSPALQR